MVDTGSNGREVSRAVILAAGRGKRLGQLTARLPKPMLPVQGRPVLEHIQRGIASTAIDQFLFVVGYRKEAIEAHFGNGEAWGCHIDYVVQGPPGGTGAALRLASGWAAGAPVLASYGDILTDRRHYRELVDRFRDTDAAAVIGINPVADPYAGAAVFREVDRIVRVQEKPPPGSSPSRWNLAGVSVYGPAIWPILETLKPSPRGEVELTDAIGALIEQEYEVLAYEMRGYWSDIGTPKALAAAEQMVGEWMGGEVDG